MISFLKKIFEKKALVKNEPLDETVPISKILTPLDKIIEHWRHTQLKLNDPATIDLINDTQQKISFHFPDDFTNFYLKVNGFKDLDMTNEMFCVWTLERIVEEFEKSNNKNFTPFCDYLIDSHRIGYLKDNLEVYKDYYDEKMYKITDTLEETIKLIVIDSELLY